jgi:hypothetical protein
MDHSKLGVGLAALRLGQIDAADLGKPRMDGLAEVAQRRRPRDHLAQDFPRLLFHRTTVLGRPHAQAALHVVVKVSDGDAAHACLPVLLAS